MKVYMVHLQFDLHYQKVKVFDLECRIIYYHTTIINIQL